MRRAVKKDKSLVINIITQTFQNNPGVVWMFSKSGNRTKKIRRLAEFAFVKCLNRNGAFISSNEKGVALFYRSDIHVYSLKEICYEIRFVLLSIPLLKIAEVVRRESYRKHIRPQNEPYFYFWFLGVLKEGAMAGFELNNELIKLSKSENIPIYLETTEERNKKIYEWLGYETYNYWEDKPKNIRFWFLRWQNEKLKKS